MLLKIKIKKRTINVGENRGTVSKKEIESVQVDLGLDVPAENERLFQITKDTPATTSSPLHRANPTN